MKNNKIIKLLIVGIVISLLLAVLGASYAYFSLLIEGESKKMVTEMGSLRLKYDDTDVITLDGIIPGDSVTKTITVKNNGSMDVPYNIVWEDLYNEFIKKELTIEMKCTRLNENGIEEGTCEDLTSTPIGNVKIKTNINIEPNITHKYEVKITFIDTGASQNYNKNVKFQGKINLTKYRSNEPIYCNFDGDLIQGAEYINGQYTYRYKQEMNTNYNPVNSNYPNSIPATFMFNNYNSKKISSKYLTRSWIDIDEDGWGVALTDIDSTDPVDTSLCTYINGKPVVSMKSMFEHSDASSINLDNFNTENVVNMSNMFGNTLILQIDLSNFDTRNVTNMSGMFSDSQAKKLDLSSFDTRNVIDMGGMFYNSVAVTLDLSNFDTSKVTSMNGMFYGYKVKSLDLSNLNTSNVIDMSYMFSDSYIKTIDLSNFDTSNVNNMSYMFRRSMANKIDVSSFNTSNVTNMSNMFSWSCVTTLDLSNFDTSKVTNMELMFAYSYSLSTIYTTNSFDTSSLSSENSGIFNGSSRLVGGAGTKYSSSHKDKEYARIDGGTTSPGYFTFKN